MLTVLLPVTRDWTLRPVCDAIAASDIPRESLVLLIDAPGCDEWFSELLMMGFNITVHRTGNGQPPAGRVARRTRHRAMRLLSQTLVPESGPLLCLEDDILVPPDIYAKLSALAPHATGVQMDRHGSLRPVIYPLRRKCGTGVELVQGCGHGCLLTTCEDYRAAEISDKDGAVDELHTSQLRPLYVDWSCVCGHLTASGVLYP